jgi:glyoxylate/hydroxypyruvate reductase A
VALLIAAPGRDCSGLIAELGQQAPEIDVRLWPDVGVAADIDFAVLWKHPPDLLARLPSLRAVSSLGAGVEHLINDPALPGTLPVGRLSGPRLAADMAAWLVGRVVAHWRDFDRFEALQRQQRWQPWAPERPPRIGLLGTGRMGCATIRAFHALEIPVTAFNSGGGNVHGVDALSGRKGLLELAAGVDYLICLLPLTAATRGLLNAELFAAMRAGSVLINVGRGQHLDEAALLAALDRGRPAVALLDVFASEPLPPGHPFWGHPRIGITPHCSAITSDREAASLAIESYRRVRSGRPPLDRIDRRAGY